MERTKERFQVEKNIANYKGEVGKGNKRKKNAKKNQIKETKEQMKKSNDIE